MTSQKRGFFKSDPLSRDSNSKMGHKNLKPFYFILKSDFNRFNESYFIQTFFF